MGDSTTKVEGRKGSKVERRREGESSIWRGWLNEASGLNCACISWSDYSFSFSFLLVHFISCK